MKYSKVFYPKPNLELPEPNNCPLEPNFEPSEQDRTSKLVHSKPIELVLRIIYDQPDKMTSAKSHDENCKLASSLVRKKIKT